MSASKYFAIVNSDNASPAWGIGNHPATAWAEAQESLGKELRNGTKCVEITAESFDAVEAGNPDAWQAA